MSKVSTGARLDFSTEVLKLRTRHPFGISYGTASERPSILVRMTYDGIEGLGEACPASYHCESLNTVMACLDDMKNNQVLGDDPFAIEEVLRVMEKTLSGHYAAKAALEMAMQDICGKIVGKPLYQIYGLSKLEAPITDFTIGIDNLDMLARKTVEAVEAGFKVLKVKQGTSYDRQIIECVRKHAPDLPLRVDANGAWSPKQAIEMSKYLADNQVQFIEQPLPKHAPINDWRLVHEHAAIPIFADESCCRSNDVARLAGVIDGIVIKLAKSGGISEAIKLVHTARAHGLAIMIGCMIESSVGITAAAHISSLVDYLDLDGAMLLAEDPFAGVEYKDGHLLLPERPGLGVIARS